MKAWKWHNENIGKDKCPIVDTWWQTETGGIMISLANVTKGKPTFATKPLIGTTCPSDDEGKEFHENNKNGILAIKFPWPSIARTIYGDHENTMMFIFQIILDIIFLAMVHLEMIKEITELQAG